MYKLTKSYQFTIKMDENLTCIIDASNLEFCEYANEFYHPMYDEREDLFKTNFKNPPIFIVEKSIPTKDEVYTNWFVPETLIDKKEFIEPENLKVLYHFSTRQFHFEFTHNGKQYYTDPILILFFSVQIDAWLLEKSTWPDNYFTGTVR